MISPVTILRRPLSRFVLWATVIVAVAVAAGAAGLDWWLIVVVVFVAWGAVTLAERALALPAADRVRAPRVHAPVHDVSEDTGEIEGVKVISRAPEPAPVATPEPVREPERRRPAPPPPAAPAPAAVKTDNRNIWVLERIAKAHPEREELEFLVISLREYAGSDGTLSAEFDSLVRESFGDLLSG